MALLLIAVYVAAVVALVYEGVRAGRAERRLNRECRPWGEWR